MRKVTLSMKAQEQYTIIKRLAQGHLNKNYAAIKIGCMICPLSSRQVKYLK